MNGEWECDQTKFLLSIIREGTQIQTEQIRDRFCNLVRLKGAVTFPIPYVEYPCISEKENQRLHVVKQSFMQAIKEVGTLAKVALTICLDENINPSYDNIFNPNTNPEIRVLVEKWSNNRHAFNIIELFLPSGRIIRIIGFSEKEADKNIQHVMNLKDIIWGTAKEGSSF